MELETSKEEQIPWSHPLAVIRGRKDKDRLQTSTTFYDISTNRCIRKSIPEMRNKIICSSSFYGWLVLKDVDSKEYCLFHLESKNNIKLPSVQPQQGFFFLSSPPTNADCRVVFYDETIDNVVIICKPGDDKFAIQEAKIIDETCSNGKLAAF
ncbi:hypothetical protein COLO4_22279 [Corchorus olitorius]|uniref:KIB1-4 beta-propeller domain-containing protein n=1 Tax=Corchorus olitorius TaxID=93759 RepID=A0A1R3IN50_9ROSI|nr:hypothetical protein COLO4_22279 [Corchorus olitorius]